MNIEAEVLHPSPETGAGIAANQKIRDQLAIDIANSGVEIQQIPFGVSKYGLPNYKEESDRRFVAASDRGLR